VVAVVWAFTRFEFWCKVETAKTDATSNNAKINDTLILFCVES
jgi:hypothetical protein